jgi:hypothetical protein
MYLSSSFWLRFYDVSLVCQFCICSDKLFRELRDLNFGVVGQVLSFDDLHALGRVYDVFHTQTGSIYLAIYHAFFLKVFSLCVLLALGGYIPMSRGPEYANSLYSWPGIGILNLKGVVN